MRRLCRACPDSCRYGAVRIAHFLCTDVCVPRSGADENTTGPLRLPLDGPPPGPVLYEKAGGHHQHSRRRRHTLNDPRAQGRTDYWGIARTHILSQKVWNYDWTNLPASFRTSAEAKVRRTARRVRRCAANLTPSFKVKCLFTLYQFLHRKQKMSAVDDAYWQEQGYTTGKPWQ